MTALWRTREELCFQAITLHAQGLSRRAIARALGVSRNTVRGLVEEHASAREEPSTALPTPPTKAPRASALDAFEARILELFGLYPDITAQRIFEILQAEGFAGGYTAIKKRVRRLRPRPRPAPSLATPEWGPGEMAESDWSPYEVDFTRTGRQIVQAFSYALTFSRRPAIGLYESCDLHALMDGHVRAFDRFGGCAAECTYDSQKAVVLRWEGHQPIYNPRFLAFAAHYEFRPRGVRGEPNAKAKVERGFWTVERSFLNGRSFADLDDMRAQLADWLDTVVDHRRRNKQSPTPLERFAEERDRLVPLPRHPYDTARVVYRVCSIDGFVAWDGNHYAVPYDHVTDLLPVRITQRELFVYAANLACVARHELAPRGLGARVDPTGLHPRPQRKSPIDADQLRVAFEHVGERAAGFFRLMSAGPPKTFCHHARLILRLRERYETADLDKALGHAAAFGAFEHAAVERILAARASPRSLDEYVAEPTVERITRALGAARTRPRDLALYDRLPGAPSADAKEIIACPKPPDPEADPPPNPPVTTPSPSDSEDTSSTSD